MELFVREDGDVYRVFFGPDTAGYIKKEDLKDVDKVEHILRRVAYDYYWKLNPPVRKTYVKKYRQKDQGIIKDFFDMLW